MPYRSIKCEDLGHPSISEGRSGLQNSCFHSWIYKGVGDSKFSGSIEALHWCIGIGLRVLGSGMRGLKLNIYGKDHARDRWSLTRPED